MRKKLTLICAAISMAATAGAAERSFIDFFKPMEPGAPLVSEGTWGVDAVMPRDTTNGLEDTDLSDWCYWDGTIIKGEDGKYRMYASRWSQTNSHNMGWHDGSRGTIAISDNMMGPYRDQGMAWPQWKDGLGHNVVALRLKDGRYAMFSSEITDGEVFISDNPDGPFEWYGTVERDANGFYEGWMQYDELDSGAAKGGKTGWLSNIIPIIRHDGRYMILPRQCGPMITDSEDILGPYKLMGNRAWWGTKGLPQWRMEDPTIWYSDGLYHIVLNQYSGGDSHHLTSEDGIDNWKYRGIAYNDHSNVFKYTDGTVNHWGCVQRPTVYVEDGHIKCFFFSVVDTGKGGDKPNDQHGSKIVILPFDGNGFSKYITKVVKQENELIDHTPLPTPWLTAAIGSSGEPKVGYDKEFETMRLYSDGDKVGGKKDKLEFIYQPIKGDFSHRSQVMYQDLMRPNFEAGIMLRSSLKSDAKALVAMISNERGLVLSQRTTEGGQMEEILNREDIEAPYWLRMERRGNEVELFISTSNMMNWESVATTEIELGDEVLAGMAATNLDGKSKEIARFKRTDLHEYGKPLQEGIVAHTFPDVIPASGVIDFEVEYECEQTMDVYVELEQINTLKKYPALRLPLKKDKGTMQLQYVAGEKLDPSSAYWFTIKAVPLHFHDSQDVQSAFKRVTVEE